MLKAFLKPKRVLLILISFNFGICVSVASLLFECGHRVLFYWQWTATSLYWSFCVRTCGVRCAGQCTPECQHLNHTRIYSRKDLACFITFVCVIYDLRGPRGRITSLSFCNLSQFKLLLICLCLYFFSSQVVFIYLVAIKAFYLDFIFWKKTWAQIHFPFFLGTVRFWDRRLASVISWTVLRVYKAF